MRSLLRGLLTPLSALAPWSSSTVWGESQTGGGSKAHCELSFEGHFLCACQPDIKLSSPKDSFRCHGDSLSIAFLPQF